ncbi:LON peptidase N-terminal domain and RING finger protein 1-like isoform X4 [Sipha flava]|uniref:LON peptidase N-terminal domain and RING finger protein 1-like isoform X4 n=1 Tax=Sipha flava TaxID=143950 RepID=A0A8B8G740_9HEMI|nr:LON peptidase N-terminal domain and RING finger protein 1-like isoform X4 [Sipha flava]
MSSVCMFYMRGSCRFGNRCWNSHDLQSVRSDSPLFQLPISFFLDETTDDEDIILPTELRRMESTSAQTAAPTNALFRTRPTRSSQDPVEKSQKNQVESQNVYSLTNKNSGDTREGTPDTMLVEAVKKLNEAENLVNSLRQQLRSINDGANFSWIEHQMEQCIENDLQCNICYEMYIKPTVLNCSHTFCHECIESWTRRVNQCPICRVYVRNKSYCLPLDTFLDKITECLPEDIKSRRESLKIERNNNRTVETNRNRRNNTGRRNRRNQSMRRTLGVLWGERDREGADWNIALEETLFDPIRLGDVLGRNRNDRDIDNDWDDNFSDGSFDRFYLLE